jgi:hypothetical protein
MHNALWPHVVLTPAMLLYCCTAVLLYCCVAVLLHRVYRAVGGQHPKDIIISPAPSSSSITVKAAADPTASDTPDLDPSTSPPPVSMLQKLHQLLLATSQPLRQQQGSRADRSPAAAAPAAPDTTADTQAAHAATSSSNSSSGGGTSTTAAALQQEQQHNADADNMDTVRDMSGITLSHTQQEHDPSDAALRGGKGGQVLGVGQEEDLVQQALRLLLARDGAGDLEAAKVGMMLWHIAYLVRVLPLVGPVHPTTHLRGSRVWQLPSELGCSRVRPCRAYLISAAFNPRMHLKAYGINLGSLLLGKLTKRAVHPPPSCCCCCCAGSGQVPIPLSQWHL